MEPIANKKAGYANNSTQELCDLDVQLSDHTGHGSALMFMRHSAFQIQ